MDGLTSVLCDKKIYTYANDVTFVDVMGFIKTGIYSYVPCKVDETLAKEIISAFLLDMPMPITIYTLRDKNVIGVSNVLNGNAFLSVLYRFYCGELAAEIPIGNEIVSLYYNDNMPSNIKNIIDYGKCIHMASIIIDTEDEEERKRLEKSLKDNFHSAMIVG